MTLAGLVKPRLLPVFLSKRIGGSLWNGDWGIGAVLCSAGVMAIFLPRFSAPLTGKQMSSQ